MTESQIERAVCLYAKSLGHLAYKFVSPGRSGVPDRMILTPSGGTVFIEFKTPTGKLSPLQLNEHRILKRQGFDVHVVACFEHGKDLIDEL